MMTKKKNKENKERRIRGVAVRSMQHHLDKIRRSMHLENDNLYASRGRASMLIPREKTHPCDRIEIFRLRFDRKIGIDITPNIHT